MTLDPLSGGLQLRELRSIRDQRFKRRHNSLRRRFLFALVVSAAIGIGIILIVPKVKTKPSTTELSPGKIYTKGDQQKLEDIPPKGIGKSDLKEPEKEAPADPESFTFYKVLNSKEGDIVPLTGDIPKPVKEDEGEIKPPQHEEISEIEKEMDKNIEKRVKRDDVYAVQVAALSNESTANGIVSRLKLQGYAPYLIKEEDKKGGRLYKIRVGRFPSIVDAQEVAKVLKKDGYATYVIKGE